MDNLEIKISFERTKTETLNKIQKVKEKWQRFWQEAQGSSLIRAPKNMPDIVHYKQKALAVISDRAQFFATQMGVQYKRLTITSAKKRWGSCTQQGHVNFSWRLAIVPLHIIDYVVVHELAHLRHLNHSKKFWEFVGSILPDFKQRRDWLKENGQALSL